MSADVGELADLEFVVRGTPAPQGSKRHVGRGILVESSAKVKPWREAVKAAYVALEMPEGIALPGPAPVAVRITFYLPRPKGHYGTGKNAGTLRDSAPSAPAGKPDLDKLLRSTLDGLGEAGVWTDDAQVTLALAEKCYADAWPLGVPGAAIRIARMAP